MKHFFAAFTLVPFLAHAALCFPFGGDTQEEALIVYSKTTQGSYETMTIVIGNLGQINIESNSYKYENVTPPRIGCKSNETFTDSVTGVSSQIRLVDYSCKIREIFRGHGIWYSDNEQFLFFYSARGSTYAFYWHGAFINEIAGPISAATGRLHTRREAMIRYTTSPTFGFELVVPQGSIRVPITYIFKATKINNTISCTNMPGQYLKFEDGASVYDVEFEDSDCMIMRTFLEKEVPEPKKYHDVTFKATFLSTTGTRYAAITHEMYWRGKVRQRHGSFLYTREEAAIRHDNPTRGIDLIGKRGTLHVPKNVQFDQLGRPATCYSAQQTSLSFTDNNGTKYGVQLTDRDCLIKKVIEALDYLPSNPLPNQIGSGSYDRRKPFESFLLEYNVRSEEKEKHGFFWRGRRAE